MLYLISAPPRTGKSLKAIEIIFKYLNQGRIVYTNIIGITIPGVITFTSPIQDPHDWRDLPNNSVIIYDEAHEHPAFADRNLIADKQRMQQIRDIGISLTLHGHFGFDIYMITQNPRLLCAEVLASVGTHYIMRRKFGYDMATIFEYAEAKTTFSKHTAQDALNRTFWKYPKHLYKFYKSSEVHNIKKTFPAKYYAFALLPLFLVFYGINNAYKTGFFGMFENKEQTAKELTEKPINLQNQSLPQNNAQGFGGLDERTEEQRRSDFNNELQHNREQLMKYNVNTPYDIDYTAFQYQVQQAPQLSGCAIIDKKCTCYSQQATRLDISQTDCKRYMSGDKPFNPFLQVNQNQGFNNATNYNQGNSSLSSQQDTPQISIDDYARLQEYQRLKQEYQRSQPPQQNEIAHGFG